MFSFRSILAVGALGTALTFSGCQSDTADNITINNNNPGRSARVTYVVQVLDAAGNQGGRTAGLPGVQLTYFNAREGRTVTSAASNSEGLIIVRDLPSGTLAGSLRAPGYSTLSYTADLSQTGTDTAYVATTRVYMIQNTASISGRVYGDYNQTGATPLPTQANNQREVQLQVNYRFVRAGEMAYPLGTGPGRITDLSLDPITVPIQTTSNGAFQVDGLHATESGMVEATLTMIPQEITNQSGTRTATFSLPDGNRRSLRLVPGTTLRLGDILATAQN